MKFEYWASFNKKMNLVSYQIQVQVVSVYNSFDIFKPSCK